MTHLERQLTFYKKRCFEQATVLNKPFIDLSRRNDLLGIELRKAVNLLKPLGYDVSSMKEALAGEGNHIKNSLRKAVNLNGTD